MTRHVALWRGPSREPGRHRPPTRLSLGTASVATTPPPPRHGPPEVVPLPPLDGGLQAHLDVLTGREGAEDLQALEGPGQPETGTPVRLHRGHVGVEEVDGAPVGYLQTADHVEECGLAGSVGADQTGHRSRAHGQGHVVERRDATEPHGDLGDGEGSRSTLGVVNRRHGSPRPWPPRPADYQRRWPRPCRPTGTHGRRNWRASMPEHAAGGPADQDDAHPGEQADAVGP